MKTNRNIVAVVFAASLAGVALPAQADEKFSFPSVSGATITTSPHFVPLKDPQGFALNPIGVTGMSSDGHPPLPTYQDRFGMLTTSGDAYGYRFLTHALASQAYRNYEQDYYRIFGPGYPVTTWTDRVLSGYIEVGYGGAIDAWTAGAYYLAKLRGPRRRHESAPDLSPMPQFRPHPELESAPTFEVR